ncbi:MAG: hypothetical protein AABY64_14940 [Bdellovibrionota bacterium]
MALNPLLKKATWLDSDDIRPYVFVRPENQISLPGARHRLDWFTQQAVVKNPLHLEELPFAEQIYFIENAAFGPSAMPMPRWVFYDCAVMPGFVAGFACRTKKLPAALQKILPERKDCDWTPLSLFIINPTMHKGEWVAHNLCSVNSLLAKEAQLYGLGFLSKAFGMWYANIEQCTGMTQWGGAALKLHSHYGHLEIIGAYAPVHSHAKTVTYRVKVDTNNWEQFFTKEPDLAFLEKFEPTEIEIDPRNENSMIDLQYRIQKDEGPFYLSAGEIASKALTDKLKIYRMKSNY